jgi:hypothetical protein
MRNSFKSASWSETYAAASGVLRDISSRLRIQEKFLCLEFEISGKHQWLVDCCELGRVGNVVFMLFEIFSIVLTRPAAVCTHTDRIHPIPINIFVRLVLSRVRRAEAVVSRRSWYLILHKT